MTASDKPDTDKPDTDKSPADPSQTNKSPADQSAQPASASTDADAPPRYRRSPHADATQAGASAVIYHRQTGSAITLNPAAALLWHRLATPATSIELAELMQKTWPTITPETAHADAAAFLEALQTHNLIHKDPPQ